MKLLLPIIDKNAPIKKLTVRSVKDAWIDEEFKNCTVACESIHPSWHFSNFVALQPGIKIYIYIFWVGVLYHLIYTTCLPL